MPLFGAITGLVLPTWCPGCGEAGVSLCRECARSLSFWFRADPAAPVLPPHLPVWAVGPYTGVAARIILAWKSGHRPDLQAPLERLAHQMGVRVARTQALEPPVLVVPAPSGRRRRWSGNEVVAPLARALARGLTSAGASAESHQLLRRRGGGEHHLGRAQRRTERASAIFLARPPRSSTAAGPWAQVLLVDDVLTTGATLTASAKACEAIGPVRGAIVLAATPEPM